MGGKVIFFIIYMFINILFWYNQIRKRERKITYLSDTLKNIKNDIKKKKNF